MQRPDGRLDRRSFLAGSALACAEVARAQAAPRFEIEEQPKLSLRSAGQGLDRTVTIESSHQFRLRFSSADNWGLDQWFDLVNDPEAQVDLLAPHDARDLTVIEPAMFQQVFYGTKPDDPKLFTTAAKYYFPDSQRSFEVLVDSPDLVVVESSSSPMVNAVGVLSNVTSKVRYEINPTGRIRVRCETSVVEPQSIANWICANIGLRDPTSSESIVPPDHVGWIRCTSTQSPYRWSKEKAAYIYAYWNPATPAPFESWTKASILLVPHPSNPIALQQFAHNWPGFKRWGYSVENVQLAAGQRVIQNYLIHLGTTGSRWLPALSDRAATGTIAQAYLRSNLP